MNRQNLTLTAVARHANAYKIQFWKEKMTILVTGGAGFIGANFVLDWVAHTDEKIVNLDKLTYAGNLESLAPLKNKPQHVFVQGDIGDSALLPQLLAQH